MADQRAELKKYEAILKALASKRRLGIVRYIREHKEGSLGELAKEIKLSSKATSKHLTVLVKADILDREQLGMRASFCFSDSMPPLARLVVNQL